MYVLRPFLKIIKENSMFLAISPDAMSDMPSTIGRDAPQHSDAYHSVLWTTNLLLLLHDEL
jgi:hypothetical protein